ncbi:MAG: methyl-accepting chemotaxis protein [Syntrophus sp. (in: bacteria)]|nr:methyl-accepting chemotaxis protein [Syntrophus sp. (in: bacteria)]
MRAWLSNLQMTKKLLVSPFTAILFLLIFGLVSYAGFYRQKAALDDIFNIRFKYYQSTADVVTGLKEVHGNFYKIMNWVGSNYDQKKIDVFTDQQFATLKRVTVEIEQKTKASNLTKDEKTYFQTAANQLGKYQDALKQIVGLDQATASMVMTQADDQFQAIDKNLSELLALENKLSKEQYVSSGKTFTMVIIIAAIVFLAAILLPFGISMIMRALILNPINKTVEVIEIVAQGDLTKRIDVTSRDEIGEMAKHFNAFVDKLHDAIKRVAQSSDDVSSAANRLDTATEHMATGVEEAAMQVDSVAAASEEMSKTSSEIAQNCVMAAKSSEKANDSASTGETIIQETIIVMNRISNRVKESADIIKSLGTRSEQIGQIVGLINDVADQTNLLALNAAIEAARAGEHGRGFAVVADEVRKLAERTSNATKEIGETIRAMQTETKKAVTSMEEGVSEVGKGTTEAAKSGEALKDILHQINKVTMEINQIAVASEEETATTDEIATSIQQISMVMQETARRIQENADASAQLANLSKELQGMVGQFRL